jgi:hypothetical protein
VTGNVAFNYRNERVETLVGTDLGSGQITNALGKICYQGICVFLSSGKASHQIQDLPQISHKPPMLLNQFLLLL